MWDHLYLKKGKKMKIKFLTVSMTAFSTTVFAAKTENGRISINETVKNLIFIFFPFFK
jgi:hypothetical protein